MSAQIVFVRVHEPEAVREIVREAMTIADELARDPIQWVTIFDKACELLGARVTLMPQPAPVNFPFPLDALKNGR